MQVVLAKSYFFCSERYGNVTIGRTGIWTVRIEALSSFEAYVAVRVSTWLRMPIVPCVQIVKVDIFGTASHDKEQASASRRCGLVM
jgi:hypothetical protein